MSSYVLPGLNFTREQLFYIQFARGWARNIKPAEAVRRIRVDEHSPTNFRGECTLIMTSLSLTNRHVTVIGPLSNSEEFSKAFNCPVGSRMNPKRKCRVRVAPVCADPWNTDVLCLILRAAADLVDRSAGCCKAPQSLARRRISICRKCKTYVPYGASMNHGK
jgi:hypothetical protein